MVFQVFDGLWEFGGAKSDELLESKENDKILVNKEEVTTSKPCILLQLKDVIIDQIHNEGEEASEKLNSKLWEIVEEMETKAASNLLDPKQLYNQIKEKLQNIVNSDKIETVVTDKFSEKDFEEFLMEKDELSLLPSAKNDTIEKNKKYWISEQNEPKITSALYEQQSREIGSILKHFQLPNVNKAWKYKFWLLEQHLFGKQRE